MRNFLPKKTSWNNNKLLVKFFTTKSLISSKLKINALLNTNTKSNSVTNKFILNFKKFNFCVLNNNENKVNLALNEEQQKEIINLNNNKDFISLEAEKPNSIQISRPKKSILIYFFAFNIPLKIHFQAI